MNPHTQDGDFQEQTTHQTIDLSWLHRGASSV